MAELAAEGGRQVFTWMPSTARARMKAIAAETISSSEATMSTDSDRRLFITDPGNARILSVLLGYHVEERVPLK